MTIRDFYEFFKVSSDEKEQVKSLAMSMSGHDADNTEIVIMLLATRILELEERLKSLEYK